MKQQPKDDSEALVGSVGAWHCIKSLSKKERQESLVVLFFGGGLGLLPFVLPLILLWPLVGLTPVAQFYDGSLVIFGVTLTAAAFGSFADESSQSLAWRCKTLFCSYIALMVVGCVAFGIFVAIFKSEGNFFIVNKTAAFFISIAILGWSLFNVVALSALKIHHRRTSRYEPEESTRNRIAKASIEASEVDGVAL